MGTNFTDITAQSEYDIQFWNAARGRKGNDEVLAKGRISLTGSYELLASASGKIAKVMEKESIFRNFATVIKAYKSGYKIFSKDCKDLVQGSRVIYTMTRKVSKHNTFGRERSYIYGKTKLGKKGYFKPGGGNTLLGFKQKKVLCVFRENGWW